MSQLNELTDNNNNKIEEIKLVLKNEKNIRMYKRYSVLLKHLQGINNKDIGEMEMLDPHTVGLYIKKYTTGGLDALKMNYNNCGKKRKLSPEIGRASCRERVYVLV